MQNLHIMFCLTQPSLRGKRKKRGKDYFSIANLCISTLIRTGFPKEKITCITSGKEYADQLNYNYGINTVHFPMDMPDIFQKWVNRNKQHLYYYKPFAFYNVMPEPIDEHTVMAFADLDILWKKNPYNYMIERKVDAWCNSGSELPRRNSDSSKQYEKWQKGESPPIEFDALSEYYYRCGGKAMAEVHLKYNFPVNRLLMFTQIIAIKPHVYKDLMKTWYQMCIDGAQFAEKHKMEEIGDQEFFSSAVWYMKLSYERSYRDIEKYFKHYGGERKKEMKFDFEEYCKTIDRRKRSVEPNFSTESGE